MKIHYCLQCNKKIIKPSRESYKNGERHNFCSLKCSDEYKKGKPFKHSKQFQKGMTPGNKDKKTGIVPKSAFKKGIIPGNYKGLTPLYKKIRNSKRYQLGRKECLLRDNFTCQKTGISGGLLQVHHINNFVDFPELRFDVDNGITLSKKSHEQFHKIYGVRNNTKEQLIEFLNN